MGQTLRRIGRTAVSIYIPVSNRLPMHNHHRLNLNLGMTLLLWAQRRGGSGRRNGTMCAGLLKYNPTLHGCYCDPHLDNVPHTVSSTRDVVDCRPWTFPTLTPLGNQRGKKRWKIMYQVRVLIIYAYTIGHTKKPVLLGRLGDVSRPQGKELAVRHA